MIIITFGEAPKFYSYREQQLDKYIDKILLI